jgi:hypothetical protein
MWLLNNAGLVNLFCALAVLLAGAAIYWFAKPKLFGDHPFCQRAFGFWLIQWFLLIVIWATYAGYPSRQVLATIDLYVVATFGFFWTYAEAETFEWPRTLRNLAGIFGVLLLWNLLVGTQALAKPPDSDWRWLWILPSETMSALALFLVALVFLYRYGYPAIPLAGVVVPAYAFLQRPTYYTLFIEARSSDWALALAVGKIFYGLLFYTVFFLPARGYETIQHPHFDIDAPKIVRARRWVLGAVGGLVGSVLATVLSEWLGRLLKSK